MPRSLLIGQVSFKFKSYLPCKEIVLSCTLDGAFFECFLCIDILRRKLMLVAFEI